MTQQHQALMDLINHTFGLGTAPANLAATTQSAAQGEALATAVGGTQTAIATAELIGKRVPGLVLRETKRRTLVSHAPKWQSDGPRHWHRRTPR